MTTRTANIIGAEELQRRLTELPSKLEAKILRGALRAGASVILAEVKAKTPIKTGRMLATERVSTGIRKGVARASVKIGDTKKGGVYYAHMVEGGTKPHRIAARNGKTLMVGSGSRVTYPSSVQHPGTAPRPFVKPALFSKANAALDAVTSYIKSRLDKAVKP